MLFPYLRKTLLLITTTDAKPFFYFLPVLSLRSISHATNSTNLQSSFTVSYLINSCGLSAEAAFSAAKNFYIQDPVKPDSVIAFFKKHGFTQTHISKMIAQCPKLLSSDPIKTLKPKIDFLKASSISDADLITILSSNPALLKRSLKNQIMPNYSFLKTFMHSERDIITMFKRSTSILETNFRKTLSPNILILREHGVPYSHISKLIITHPRTLASGPDRFKEIVTMVKNMNLDPMLTTFIVAVRVMTGMSKSSWEAKMEVYRSISWSDDQIISAFKYQPLCMMTSVEKIRRCIGFFDKEMGIKPSDMSLYPNILLLSFEKRILPRCMVLKILRSKGIQSRLSLHSLLKITEKKFIETFVMQYQDRAELLKAYTREIGLNLKYTPELPEFGETMKL